MQPLPQLNRPDAGAVPPRLKLVATQDRRRVHFSEGGPCSGRIYAEKPNAFVNHLLTYWQAWRPSIETDPVDARQMDLAFETASGSTT